MTPSPAHAANQQVAETFRQAADILAQAGENPFRAAAYARAATTIAAFDEDVAGLCARGDGEATLDALPGIGPDLAAKVREICETGGLQLRVRLTAKGRDVEPALRAVPGLGPARLDLIRRDLGVTTVSDLRQALQNGALARLPGFGPGLRAKLTREVAAVPSDLRWPLDWAEPQARTLASALRQVPGVADVMVAGSIRRRRLTVGDADLVVVADATADIVGAIRSRAGVSTVTMAGPHRVSLRLVSGLGVDLLIAAPEGAGAALLHFTGSKAHNIGLRRRARRMGLKLNEYGLFRGSRRIAGDTEAGIYAALELSCPDVTAREAGPPAAP